MNPPTIISLPSSKLCRAVGCVGEELEGELSVGCCIKIYGGEFELRGKSRVGRGREQVSELD